MATLGDSKIRKALGAKLKKARKLAHMTQEQVAVNANIHQNWYARVERGEENPSYEVIEAIKKALNIKSLDDL